jgi:hypothetical protein
MLDTGCSILGPRYLILDTGYSFLDARYWILDTGSLPFGNSGRQCLFLPCPILAGTEARPTDDQLQATSRVGLRADQWPFQSEIRNPKSEIETLHLLPYTIYFLLGPRVFYIQYRASSIQYRVSSATSDQRFPLIK